MGGAASAAATVTAAPPCGSWPVLAPPALRRASGNGAAVPGTDVGRRRTLVGHSAVRGQHVPLDQLADIDVVDANQRRALGGGDQLRLDREGTDARDFAGQGFAVADAVDLRIR